LHNFTALPPSAYLQIQCQTISRHLFQYILSNIDFLSADAFFSKNLPMAAFRQACLLLGAWVKIGADIQQFSGEKAVPVQCIADFIQSDKLKEIPTDMINPHSSTEDWLGYLILLIESRALLKQNNSKHCDSYSRRTVSEFMGYIANVLIYKEKVYKEKQGLFFYTEYVISTILTKFDTSNIEPVAKLLESTYFRMFPERGNIIAFMQKAEVSFRNPEPEKIDSKEEPRKIQADFSDEIRPAQSKSVRENVAISDSDDDLKSLYSQLNKKEKELVKMQKEEPIVLTAERKTKKKVVSPIKKSYEADSDDEKLSDMDMPCVSGIQFSSEEVLETVSQKSGNTAKKSDAVPSNPSSIKVTSTMVKDFEALPNDMSEFVVECKAGMLKTLAYLDKEYLAKDFTNYVNNLVAVQDHQMQSHADAFHKHFKHQYFLHLIKRKGYM